MDQQSNANSQQLMFSAQRAILRKYLTANYNIYIFFTALHIISVFNLLRDGYSFKTYTPNFIFIFSFFERALRTEAVRKRLNHPEISDLVFQNEMKWIMLGNWILIIMQVIAVGIVAGILIGINIGTSNFDWSLKWSGIIAGVVLVCLIPFFYQISRHKGIKKALEEIRLLGKSVATDQASFNNQSLRSPFGDGDSYMQPQNDPTEDSSQEVSKGNDGNSQNSEYR